MKKSISFLLLFSETFLFFFKYCEILLPFMFSRYILRKVVLCFIQSCHVFHLGATICFRQAKNKTKQCFGQGQTKMIKNASPNSIFCTHCSGWTMRVLLGDRKAVMKIRHALTLSLLLHRNKSTHEKTPVLDLILKMIKLDCEINVDL